MTSATAQMESLGDLLESLGGISPHRVRLHPPPGTATEKDLLRVLDRTAACELVDGALVEKVMGYAESFLALFVGHSILQFLKDHALGIVAGEQGAVRLLGGLVRVPDVSFVRWEKLPRHELPTAPIPDLVPDLAVEVISEGNTPGEMSRKLREYFLAGVSLVWFIDPATRTATAYTSPEDRQTLTEQESLDGGAVLPGFRLALADLFALLPAAKPEGRSRASRRKKS